MAPEIDLTASSKVVVTAPQIDLTASTRVELRAKSLGVEGDVSMQGNFTLQGAITASGEIKSSGKSLALHVHGNGNMGSPTTPPL